MIPLLLIISQHLLIKRTQEWGLPISQNCPKVDSSEGITGEQFLLDNEMLNQCPRRNANGKKEPNNSGADPKHGGERPRPQRSHPPLPTSLRPVARQAPGSPALRRLPPYPVAVPGTVTHGPLPAHAGDSPMGGERTLLRSLSTAVL